MLFIYLKLKGYNPKRNIVIFDEIELYTKSYFKNSGKSIDVIKKKEKMIIF